jgi:dihydropteroate synthase
MQLIADLDQVIREFPEYPMLVGTSRKSFIGKILDGRPATDRLAGSLATVALAVWNGAAIIRVHDVKETVDAVRVTRAIAEAQGPHKRLAV